MSCCSRSDARAEWAAGGGGFTGALAGRASGDCAAPRVLPQLLQKRAPGRLLKPQLEQAASKAPPQVSQNFAPGRLSAWQFGQVFISGYRSNQPNEKEKTRGWACDPSGEILS